MRPAVGAQFIGFNQSDLSSTALNKEICTLGGMTLTVQATGGSGWASINIIASGTNSGVVGTATSYAYVGSGQGNQQIEAFTNSSGTTRFDVSYAEANLSALISLQFVNDTGRTLGYDYVITGIILSS